ncbi:hypothetical protein O4273_26640 [Rhodococcus ruber]|uniref:hypothetical protein n=1 Tax=Rhodococcus ruber TaxID=1830 RepID=UPI0022B41CE8|nr:hypothetical protein [Rhodococcus ruber]MCZ4506408.1 hypothetical protein [Rhodococcus ruber]
MNGDEIVQIMQEQHDIRAARFQAGPHTDPRMREKVEAMLHLSDYLDDQGIGDVK